MIATGAPSSASMRTLSVRALAGVAIATAVTLVGLGVGLGYWLAAPPPAARPGATLPAEHPRSMLPFTLEQLGAISARVFKLENQAAHLSQRLGVQPSAAAASAAASRPMSDPTQGSGGPLLPPRDLAALSFDDLESRLAQLEQRFTLVSDVSVQRNLALLRIPSRTPLSEFELSSEYGNRRDPITHRLAFHPGLDFAAETGSPIRAAAGGVVSFAGVRNGYGNVVEIDHGNGLVTRYGHASKLLVQAGAVVAPGDTVALVGSTGRSTGPHLHFEVLNDGTQVDPRRYLAGLAP
jgi:murein DD-endopeptidase MepM/ murein hydrolase activator NlpD